MRERSGHWLVTSVVVTLLLYYRERTQYKKGRNVMRHDFRSEMTGKNACVFECMYCVLSLCVVCPSVCLLCVISDPTSISLWFPIFFFMMWREEWHNGLSFMRDTVESVVSNMTSKATNPVSLFSDSIQSTEIGKGFVFWLSRLSVNRVVGFIMHMKSMVSISCLFHSKKGSSCWCRRYALSRRWQRRLQKRN